MTKKQQKKIAVINDFSGFGRCSLMVSVPIISAMKVQCCDLPTAILSNHTGYEDFFFDDYTERMRPYYQKWQQLQLHFDGIYTGFLGSVRQVAIVEEFIHQFSGEDTAILVDPVMGDNGHPYTTVDKALCDEIRHLLPLSTIITPNVTEACLLSGMDYHEGAYSEAEQKEMAYRLHRLGARQIVITGFDMGDEIGDFISCPDGTSQLLRQKISGSPHAGTGDVFASVLAADAVNGVPLAQSVRKASSFVGEAIRLSDEMGIPAQDGVCFEEILCTLR